MCLDITEENGLSNRFTQEKEEIRKCNCVYEKVKKIEDLNPRIRNLQKELKQLTQERKKLQNDLKTLDELLTKKVKILKVRMEQMELKENIKNPCTPSLNGNYWTTDNSKRIKKKKKL